MKTDSIHPTAVIDQPCEIGDGTRVWHFSHVCAGATIGAGCSLGQNTFVAGGAVLGNNVKIQNNVSIYDRVTIEDDVFLGPSCVLTTIPSRSIWKSVACRLAWPSRNELFTPTS